MDGEGADDDDVDDDGVDDVLVPATAAVELLAPSPEEVVEEVDVGALVEDFPEPRESVR